MRIKWIIFLIAVSMSTLALAATLVPTGMDSVTGQYRIASPSDTLSIQTQTDWNQASSSALDYIKNKPGLMTKDYEGVTLRNGGFGIFKSATVSGGVAIFYLTADNTSGGAALFPTGVIPDSINAFVSDATASYQMSYVLSNGNKTLTVTVNKLTTSNILTGILGQAAANGAVVHLQVWAY